VTDVLQAAPPAPRFVGSDRVYAFADQVASEPAAPDAAEAAALWETWVSFRLSSETFAFPVDTIQEILRVGTITRVPDAPHPVRGIINLRGRVVPVVDLRVRLGLKAEAPGPRSRILVASVRGRVIGLLVDAVEQVVRLDRNRFEAPPTDVMTDQSAYITAVYQQSGGLLILLDPEQVLIIVGTTPDTIQEKE
jgi:purine-binding chemotaxis protein CheW